MGRFWILSAALALCATPVFGQQEGDEIDRKYHDAGLAKREKPTLLDLVRRQTCRYPCPNTDTCASTSSDKCCNVGGFCYAWEECCGLGCISFLQECCANGNYCDAGENCCNDSFGGCCDIGYACNANTGRCSFGGGGGTGSTGGGNAATPGTATRTSITAATGTATATGRATTAALGSRYYDFTITWVYTSWYWNYDFAIRFSTVTSTRVTTSRRTSVYALNLSEASDFFDAITATFSTPAPPFSATDLSASASQINAARSSSAGGPRSTTVVLSTPTPTAGGGGGTAGGAGVSRASVEASAWSICTVALVVFAPLLLAVAL